MFEDVLCLLFQGPNVPLSNCLLMQSCFCEECRNKTDNIERSNAINAIITKDPFAFSKNSQTEGNVIGEKCNCKRSGCIKKYCDCFRLGLKCGEECGCVGCHNRGDKEK